ncbi:MAG TPA: sialidase family protein [Gemmatimonadales bacterium]|nr:sialidase family protein [Gemmatimonadales bacterium]
MRDMRFLRLVPVMMGLATMALVSPRLQSAPVKASGNVTVRRIPHAGIQPEAVVDVKGVLHLIYFSGPPAGGDLYYVRSSDLGATFSTPVRINSQSGSAIATGTIRGGQLALGRGGRVHVVWNGSDTARPRGAINPDNGKPGAPFLYARSSPDGRRFEPQRNLSGGVYSVDGGGTIAADGNGHVYAVWHGNREAEGRGEDHRTLWIARSADEGVTFAPEATVWQAQTGACGCCQTRALATAPRGLTILYRSATNLTHRDMYVLTSNDGGATFGGSIVQPWELNACPMTSLSLASAGAGTVAAWETAGQVYFGSVDAAAGRIPKITPAPGSAAGRKHPRLAVNASGQTLLVWTEKTGWARGGSVAWQVFDTSGPQGTTGAAASLAVWSFATAVARPDGGFVVLY